MLSGLSYTPVVHFGAKNPRTEIHRGTDTCGPDVLPRVPQQLMPFATAADNGADVVELDVRPNFEAIFQVKAGKDGKLAFSFMGEPVPTLKDVLNVLPPHVKILLEVKSGKVYFPSKGHKVEKLVAEFIRENDLYDRFTIISFSPLILRLMEKLDPKINTALRWMFPKHHHASPEVIDRAHRQGIMAVPWVSGNYRAEERDNFPMYVEEGVDGTVTNTTDAMRERTKEAAGKNNPKFSGTKGRNDAQNLLMPNWVIGLYSKYREPGLLWKDASGRYQKLTQALRANGLSDRTVREIHAFTERAMGFPAGLHLGLGNDEFKTYYKGLDEDTQKHARYMLDRYAMFLIDHYSGVFENLENDAQWETLGWFLNGLLAHPENNHIYFTVQPLGLITKKLAQALETKSPYYKALEQLVAYEKSVLDEAFMGEGTRTASGQKPTDAERQRAYKQEQENFACNVLYDLVMRFPQQYDVSPAVAEFIENDLPQVLAAFRENYPPPKVISENGEGDLEYFGKLQKFIVQNAVMLIAKSDRLTRAPQPLQRPDGPQRPFVVQHTPLNHLTRSPEWRGGLR